jgi:hypothetical protein
MHCQGPAPKSVFTFVALRPTGASCGICSCCSRHTGSRNSGVPTNCFLKLLAPLLVLERGAEYAVPAQERGVVA